VGQAHLGQPEHSAVRTTAVEHWLRRRSLRLRLIGTASQAKFILRSNDSKRGWLRRFLKRNEPLIPKIEPERRSKAFSSHSIAASASPRPVWTYAKWYGDTNSRSARSRSFCSISHARCTLPVTAQACPNCDRKRVVPRESGSRGSASCSSVLIA
jgi:hypothetical protein